MNDFIILPKFDFQSAPVMAESEEDALARFAAFMDSDMSQYFIAVPAAKVNNYIGAERWRQHVIFVTSWMKDVLMDNYDLDDATAQDIAEQGFEIYCCGDGYTEYEAVEEAYNKYVAEQEEKS